MFSEVQNLNDLKRRVTDVCSYRSIDQFRRNSDDIAKKPRCIIIDGIEYAPLDYIRFLFQFVSRSDKSAQKKPLICTCNNL